MIKINKNDIYEGVNEEQVEIVERLIREGRRYFGSSGASLTQQMYNPVYKDAGIKPELAQVGLAGEHKTTDMLLEWMEDKPGLVLVDSVHVKGYGEEEYNEETGTMDGGDTDHILIAGNLVIIIDSKNWKGRRKYQINDRGEVLRANATFPGGKISTRQATRLWGRFLSPYGARATAVVNITADKIVVVRDRNWWKQPFRLVTQELFIEWMDNLWTEVSEADKSTINVNLVAAVAANAIKPYNVIKEEMGEIANLLYDIEV